MALEKLQIKSYSDAACTELVSGPIDAFINPESYSINSKIEYEGLEVVGDSKESKAFKGIGPDVLTLSKLVVDGTGIVSLGNYTSVDAYITSLRNAVCKFNGTKHRANYLMITWGSSFKYIGVCTSFKVNYTMFKPDGSALRATVDMVVESTIDFKTKGQMANLQSPDLTHFRIAKAGDTLPLMTYRIYGTSSYYLEVARVNGLKNIHALKPGDQIYFPPLKK